MAKIIVVLIRFYQASLSKLLPPTCIYIPTCSQYTIEAIEKKGWIKGSLLGAYRILRCHPFAKGGYDPVPENNKNSKNNRK